MDIKKEILKCKNKDDLFKLAKKNNYPLSEEGAEIISKKLYNGTLSDDELASISGGSCSPGSNTYKTVYYETLKEADDNLLFKNGEFVKKHKEGCRVQIDCTRVVRAQKPNDKKLYYRGEYHVSRPSDLWCLAEEFDKE